VKLLASLDEISSNDIIPFYDNAYDIIYDIIYDITYDIEHDIIIDIMFVIIPYVYMI
jgi:hypothetical protein